MDSIERSVVQENQTLQRLSQLEKLMGSPSKAGTKSGGGRTSKSNTTITREKLRGRERHANSVENSIKASAGSRLVVAQKNQKPRLDKESLNMP